MFEQEAEIALQEEVSPGTFLLGMKSPEIAKAAVPGQFVMIRPHRGLEPLLRRPFSICGLSGEGSFRVLYRVVGRGTKILSERSIGERVQVLGPLGNGFKLQGLKAPYRLVGGGMGIAPVFSLAQNLDAADPKTFSLMVGFAGAQDVLGAEEVLGQTLPARIATEDGTAGRKGLVTDLLEDALAAEKTEGVGTVCACGPPAMLRKVAGIAEKAGAACLVSLEAAMACGLGACLGCAVHAAPGSSKPFHRVCVEGPVFSADQIDWERVVKP